MKDSQKKSDILRFSEAFSELITLNPDKWRLILFWEGLFPNPEDEKLSEKLSWFLSSFHLCMKEELITTDIASNILRSLIPTLNIGSRFQKIRKELESCDFFPKTLSTNVYRLGTFIETQTRKLEDKMFDKQSAGEFDPVKANSSHFENKLSTGKNSGQEVYEGNCECIDLVLRTLYRRNKCKYGRLDINESPYGAVDFSRVLVLSSLWLGLKYLWANLILNDWHFVNKDDYIICCPTDENLFKHKAIANIRHNIFMTQLPSFVSITQDVHLEGEFWRIKKMARKIEIPTHGQEWDGKIESWELDKATTNNFLKKVVEWYLNNRFYGELIKELIVHDGDEQIAWNDWFEVWNGLNVICHAYTQAVDNQVDVKKDYQRLVAIININNLAKTVSTACKLDQDKCISCLKLLTFKPSRKRFNIWSHPLLPVDTDKVLLVPALIKGSNPILALEDLIAEYAAADYSVRGRPFEKYLCTTLNKENDIQAEYAIIASSSDKEKLEYDLIATWQDHILLIEAKCIHTVNEINDEKHARTAIDYSIEQLAKRKKKLPFFWDSIRKQCPNLAMPEEVLAEDKILCISISNLMLYSGQVKDGVVVTDDLCFKRFFGSSSVDLITLNGKHTSNARKLGSIVDKGARNPKGFIKYLLNPPQIDFVSKNMTLDYVNIPALDKDNKAIVYPRYNFNAKASNIKEQLK